MLVCLKNMKTFIENNIIYYRYIPPLTTTSPTFPETPDEISTELQKQESLLSQIHAEMNAGFVSKKREEKLWETQRIITLLKVILSSPFNKIQHAQIVALQETKKTYI